MSKCYWIKQLWKLKWFSLLKCNLYLYVINSVLYYSLDSLYTFMNLRTKQITMKEIPSVASIENMIYLIFIYVLIYFPIILFGFCNCLTFIYLSRILLKIGLDGQYRLLF